MPTHSVRSIVLKPIVGISMAAIGHNATRQARQEISRTGIIEANDCRSVEREIVQKGIKGVAIARDVAGVMLHVIRFDIRHHCHDRL